MTLADVTLGYFLLNEDSSAVVNMMDDEDTKGTWACSENTVTITIDGQDLNFTYDGASLSTEEFPIALTREEGKLSFAQLDSLYGRRGNSPAGRHDRT
ncbi:MAG: hypothetical protein IKR36_03805 [Clostridia bacterium]|nr:hypothetical protein [Clostridia bacterium]